MDNNFINKEFFRMLVGKFLGRGQFRNVYVLLSDPTKVVKIEEREQSFSNIKEWEFWQDNKDNPMIAKWLAPCHYISPSGAVLIQSRCYMVEDKKLPKMLPSFLTDTKYQNFGMLNGKVVCFDYATVVNNLNTKLRNTKWFGDREID